MLVFDGVTVIVFLCLSAFIVQLVTDHGLGVFAVFFGDFSTPFFSPSAIDNLRPKNKPTDLMAKQRIIVSVAERQLRRRERRAALVGFIAGMAVTVALVVLFR